MVISQDTISRAIHLSEKKDNRNKPLEYSLHSLELSQLMWAAGLFEGEGCITCNKQKSGGHETGKIWPRLVMCSTDFDVIDGFRRCVLGIGYLRKRDGKVHYRHKTTWEWGVGGIEGFQAVLSLLWFGLGTRRRARAREILEAVAGKTRYRPSSLFH